MRVFVLTPDGGRVQHGEAERVAVQAAAGARA